MSSKAITISFESYEELEVLHLAICEAKFNEAPHRLDIQGNPLVAKISHRIYDALAELQSDKSKRTAWLEFRQLSPTQRIFKVVRSEARRLSADVDPSEDRKREMLIDFIAPFVLTEEKIHELLATGDLEDHE